MLVILVKNLEKDFMIIQNDNNQKLILFISCTHRLQKLNKLSLTIKNLQMEGEIFQSVVSFAIKISIFKERALIHQLLVKYRFKSNLKNPLENQPPAFLQYLERNNKISDFLFLCLSVNLLIILIIYMAEANLQHGLSRKNNAMEIKRLNSIKFVESILLPNKKMKKICTTLFPQ